MGQDHRFSWVGDGRRDAICIIFFLSSDSSIYPMECHMMTGAGMMNLFGIAYSSLAGASYRAGIGGFFTGKWV